MISRILTSTNKAKVLAWAKKTGRKVLWKCDKGKWHAATDINNTPVHAAEKELVK